MIKMRFGIIIRSFMIAILISLIAVIIEAAYYGLHPENIDSISNAGYSIASPFVNNFSDLSSPVNMIILGIIFVSTFVIASSKISKREKSPKKPMKVY